MTERVKWRGGEEALLRHGVGSPVTLLVLPALFEEANRMRRFTVSVMRILAGRGIETLLPDLPGQGESTHISHILTVQDWIEFISDIDSNILISISFRGGCLLDGRFPHRWRLAPETGERLLRDMVRATAFSESISTSELHARARVETTRIAGNIMSPELYTSFHHAMPVERAFISQIEGPKLWRSAEPGDDPAFAAAVADEIAAWVQTCVKS